MISAFQAIISSFMILLILVSIFIYTHSTMELNEITLSNGNKTIIFQEMAHIASPSFYKTVDNNKMNYSKEGYYYVFEYSDPEFVALEQMEVRSRK